MSRTYNADSLKMMSLFERITRTRLKDYFKDNNDLQTFVVEEKDLGKAIGKQAANVKKLQKLLNQKIRIIGFNDDPVRFTNNLIYPLKARVELEDNKLVISSQDTKTKAFLIGRNKSNLNNNLKIIQKYFKDIKNIEIR